MVPPYAGSRGKRQDPTRAPGKAAVVATRSGGTALSERFDGLRVVVADAVLLEIGDAENPRNVQWETGE